jgi:hypothetical protein
MVEAAINAACGEDASKLSIALNFGANELFDNVILSKDCFEFYF